MKYLIVEDPRNLKHRFNIFAADNGTRYIFNDVNWSATIPELLLSIEHAKLEQADIPNYWLNRIVLSFDELPTLSYIEQYYPELLI